MTLRLQNFTEIYFTHPKTGPMTSLIRFKNEEKLRQAIHKTNNYYSITHSGKQSNITIDFMEIYDNYLHVIITLKFMGDDTDYVHKYNCAYNNKLKKFLMSN